MPENTFIKPVQNVNTPTWDENVPSKINPDGTINELRDMNDNPVILESPNDLWAIVNLIKAKNASSKTTK